MVERRGSDGLLKNQLLLDPESTLHQPKFYRLVQELTIWCDGHLPLFHPLPQSPSSHPHLQVRDTAEELPQKQWRRPWVDSPDPAFPSLQVLQWSSCLSMVMGEQPPARELNLIRFLVPEDPSELAPHSFSTDLASG